MTRTVEDAVAVFQAIVGEDPDDPITLARVRAAGAAAGRPSRGNSDYRAALCATA